MPKCCNESIIYEPHHEKTCLLHMRKQRCRSAAWYRAADQRLCMDLVGNPEDRLSHHVTRVYIFCIFQDSKSFPVDSNDNWKCTIQGKTDVSFKAMIIGNVRYRVKQM